MGFENSYKFTLKKNNGFKNYLKKIKTLFDNYFLKQLWETIFYYSFWNLLVFHKIKVCLGI